MVIFFLIRGPTKEECQAAIPSLCSGITSRNTALITILKGSGILGISINPNPDYATVFVSATMTGSSNPG
ncbi:hypothetical protein ACX1C1_19325 [Paenibacillus sp. strain BS8-2]